MLRLRPDHRFAISQFSRMRASAATSFCLSVALSAAAAAVRLIMITSASRRADRALPRFGFVKIFGDKAGVPSRHWLTPRDCFYQRAICSDELVPIVTVGVEQFAQRLRREGLRFLHAWNVLRRG